MHKIFKKKLKSKSRLAVFVLVLMGIFAGGFVAANNILWPLLAGTGDVADKSKGGQEEVLAELPGINVLIMGVDEREEERSLRTDTIILANINNEDDRISLLSIPRDTKVNLPGYGVNKANAANFYGGPEMAMEVVSGLTGVAVDYYVVTNFNGFRDIVDALGGVTLDVEEPMNYRERAYGGKYNISLPEGVQRLDGEQALMYARYRCDGLGDITRTQRQLKLLTAIGEEAMQPKTITRLLDVVPSIYNNVETNLGLTQLLDMAEAAKNLKTYQMASQTLPGWFLEEDGLSYWYVDPGTAREVTTALFEEGRVVEVVKGVKVNDSEPKQVAMDPPDGDTAAVSGETGGEANADEVSGSGDQASTTGENAAPGEGVGEGAGEYIDVGAGIGEDVFSDAGVGSNDGSGTGVDAGDASAAGDGDNGFAAGAGDGADMPGNPSAPGDAGVEVILPGDNNANDQHQVRIIIR
ncbi:MAG: LCP family protein [Firmicutes bacterium]|nr:LCP family protein [Bacillota bacterium]